MARLARGEAAVVATAAALVFTRVFGLSVVLPGFRGHYEAAFGVDPFWIGVALGAHGLTMALVQFPLGVLSDRVGRRRVLLAGSLLFVVGSAWAAVAGSIGTLVAARLLQGVGTVSSVAMAAVGETVPAARRTQAMAFIGIPAGAGFFVGFLVGPLLEPTVGVPGLFWLTAALGLLAGLPVLWAPFGRLAPDVAQAGSVPQDGGRVAANAAGAATENGAQRWVGRSVLALALAGFVNNYALQTVVFYLPHTDWQRLLPPLLVTLLLVGGLSRRIDRGGLTWQPPAVALLCGVAAAALLLGGAGGGWGFFGGVALFFTSHGVLSTSLPSQVSRLAGRSGGRGHGIQNVVAYTGTFAGGAAAGALAPHVGWAVVVLGAVAATASLFLARSLRPMGAAAPAAAV